MVKFNRVAPGDIASQFANLSQTIRTTAKRVGELDNMAENEIKAHDMFQRDLDSIFGVVGKGLVKEDYELLVQSQNALAQKEGVIKAYENFSYLDSVDKERAQIRLDAYAQEMKQHIPAMSNATTPLDLEGAEEATFGALGLKGELGVDSAGNPVTMELDSARTGEIVAMSHGLVRNRTAISAAVEDLRQEEAIKSSEQRFQSEFHNLLTISENSATRPLMAHQFKNLSHEYFGYGVKNINALQIKAIHSYALDRADNQPLTPTLEDDINSVLNELETSWEVREGAGPFAALGTDNNVQLRAIQERVRVTIDRRNRLSAAELAGNDEIVEVELQHSMMAYLNAELAANNGTLREGFEKDFSARLVAEAFELGYTDVDKVLGKFDSVISNLGLGNDEQWVANSLHTLNFTDDPETVRDLETISFGLFSEGEISFDDYKNVLTAVQKKRADMESGPQSLIDSAMREGGFGSSTISTTIISAAEDILKMNDIKVNLNAGNFAAQPHWVVQNTHDNNQLATNRRLVEADFINNKQAALTGTNIPPLLTATNVTGQGNQVFSPEKHAFLLEAGIDAATLQEVNILLTGIDMADPGENIVIIRQNMSQVAKRASVYSQYLAMNRLWEYKVERDLKAEEAEKEAFTNAR